MGGRAVMPGGGKPKGMPPCIACGWGGGIGMPGCSCCGGGDALMPNGSCVCMDLTLPLVTLRAVEAVSLVATLSRFAGRYVSAWITKVTTNRSEQLLDTNFSNQNGLTQKYFKIVY